MGYTLYLGVTTLQHLKCSSWNGMLNYEGRVSFSELWLASVKFTWLCFPMCVGFILRLVARSWCTGQDIFCASLPTYFPLHVLLTRIRSRTLPNQLWQGGQGYHSEFLPVRIYTLATGDGVTFPRVTWWREDILKNCGKEEYRGNGC